VSTQPEALRLADWLDADACDLQTPRLAAAELRRLHAVNAELLDLMQRAVGRLEIEHRHGGSIMSEWIIDARAAIARAEEVKP
jgi:hypothetical protein